MKIVNRFWVATLLDPVAGLADDDAAVRRYQRFDADDPGVVRAFAREKLKPFFDRWDEASREKGKLALQYVLSFAPDDLGHLLDSVLPPFASPVDASAFFGWIWDEIFEGEAWILENRAEFRIVDRAEETNSLRLCRADNSKPGASGN